MAGQEGQGWAAAEPRCLETKACAPQHEPPQLPQHGRARDRRADVVINPSGRRWLGRGRRRLAGAPAAASQVRRG
jgi:hypothetical protein